GVARELGKRQADPKVENLIGTNAGRREITIGAAARGSEIDAARSGAVGDKIILIHAVAADPQPAHQSAVDVEPHAAREEDDTALIRARGLRALRAGVVHIIDK